MLEGLDIAPLIESGGFTPEAIAAPEAGAATLEAALREAARTERAAERADATMLDLWLHRPGGANLSALERPAPGAQTSWHALAALSGDGGGVLDLGGGKDVPLFAAFGENDEPHDIPGATVVAPNQVDDDSDWAYFWSSGDDGDYLGGDQGGGGLAGAADAVLQLDRRARTPTSGSSPARTSAIYRRK